MGRHKMHPDDVNARDWEFMLSERFPEVPAVAQTDGWVGKGLSWLSPGREDAVERARVALVNAWPNGLEGESLEPLVESLERAFEPPKRPAVSKAPRGDSTKERFEVDQLAEPIEHHPYGTTPEGLSDQVRVEHEAELRRTGTPFPSCVDRVAAADQEARRRWPQHFEDPHERIDKLATLKARLNKSCERFDALGIQVEPVVRDSQLGVRLLSAGSWWSILPGTVMTLTEAELWLDHFEQTEYSPQNEEPPTATGSSYYFPL